MITQWTLRNFKSVYEPVALEMAPLTIFAGANSSGKSTIIQSILMVAQTLQSPVTSRALILNSHLTRLGAFDDILSNGAAQKDIFVAFQLNVRQGGGEVMSSSAFRRIHYGMSDLESTNLISCNFVFNADGSDDEKETLQLQPRVERSEISVNYLRRAVSSAGEVKPSEETTDSIVVRRSRIPVEERRHSYKIVNSLRDVELQSLQYEILHPSSLMSSRRYLRRPGVKKTLVGAQLLHFLPYHISYVYDFVEEAANFLIGILKGELLDKYYISNFESYNALAYDILTKSLENYQLRELIVFTLKEVAAEEMGTVSIDSSEIRFRVSINRTKAAINRLNAQIDHLGSDFDFGKFISAFQRLDDPTIKQVLLRAFSPKTEQIKQLVRSGQEPLPVLSMEVPSEKVAAGADFVQSFFSSAVKYLGPLRDEPKAIYPLAGANDTKDVGLRGEYTAAVLEVNRNNVIEYLPSKYFSAAVDATERSMKVKGTLMEAVLDWLKYMGVVSGIVTRDVGKMGHELKVATPDSDSLHDLTHVGVGVSQVLPILVLSLLSDKGSTIIFEQPELHLHPRVQTRLADFFVSMISLDKQCVIETHSEYLINRLRFRSAVSKDNLIPENVVVYFAEQDKGHSKYKQITINKYGVIPDWPIGFFDESEALSEEIIRAGMMKRRKEMTKNPEVSEPGVKKGEV